MDNAYRNAVDRRDAIKEQITALESDLSRLESWLDFHRELSAGTDPGHGHHTDEAKPSITVVSAAALVRSSASAELRRGLTRVEGAPIIRKIIVENGKPMQRGSLLDALELNGTPIGGADPSNNLGTMMWRMKDKFVNLDGHGYWPIDLTYQPAGYRATIDDVVNGHLNTAELDDVQTKDERQPITAPYRVFR